MIAVESTTQSQATWPVSALRPSPYNPRGPISEGDVGELAQSIREQGVLQPLVVTPEGVVLVGHRRLLAAALAGLSEVPVVVREALGEAEQIAIALAENIQRQDLTLVQEARGFARLAAAGLGSHEIARRLGLQGGYVSMRLKILELDPQVQELFGRRELPVTLIRPLARVGDWTAQRRLASLAVTRRMTVRQIEEVIERGQQGKNGASSRGSPLDGAASPAAQPAPSAPTAKAELPSSRWPSRSEAVALLMREPGRTFTAADLAAVFDKACGVCKECGLAEMEVACRECPGPAMVARLVR